MLRKILYLGGKKKKQRKGTKDGMTASKWLSIYFFGETSKELFALRSSTISFRRPHTQWTGPLMWFTPERVTNDHFQWLNISVYHYLNRRAEWELNYGFAILNGRRMWWGGEKLYNLLYIFCGACSYNFLSVHSRWWHNLTFPSYGI
jgi:hypothetical protein